MFSYLMEMSIGDQIIYNFGNQRNNFYINCVAQQSTSRRDGAFFVKNLCVVCIFFLLIDGIVCIQLNHRIFVN